MRRLSVRALLCVAAAGFGGASTWQFVEVVEERGARRANRVLLAEAADANRLGRGFRVERGGDRYDGEFAEPWRWFERANFVGRVAKPEVGGEPGRGATPAVSPEPLRVAEIIAPTGIFLVGSDAVHSELVVRYRDGVDVEVPAGLVAREAGAVDLRASASATPDPRRPAQHLRIGDRLWPPHADVELVGIDGRSGLPAAHFRRAGDGRVQKVYVEQSGLGQSVLAALDRFLASRPMPRRAPAATPRRVTPASRWIDVARTREVDGAVHVSRRDVQRVRTDPQRVFGSSVGLRAWRSRSGRRAGVRITRLSREHAAYGLTSDDVVLSLNDNPVASRAQVLTVGRRLYRQGVREFRLSVLSRSGRTEVRSYHLPDD